MVCRQFYTKPVSQQMAPLPADRIVPPPPFPNVGLDFAGPLYLKNRGEKAYICAVTRAVHVELVSNMTTERFSESWNPKKLVQLCPQPIGGVDFLNVS